MSTWDVAKLVRFNSLLEKAVEKALGYCETTKTLIDSFEQRAHPFPTLSSLKCRAEEAIISSQGGILLCVPTDQSLLGEDGLIMLEVTAGSKKALQARRALCISLNEEFTTSAWIVDADEKAGLKGVFLNLLAKEQELSKMLLEQPRVTSMLNIWRMARAFSPFILIEEGREFTLKLGNLRSKNKKGAKLS